MSAPAATAVPAAEWAGRAMDGWNRMVNQLPTIAGRIAAAALLIAVGTLILRLGRKLIKKLYHRNDSEKKETPSGQTRTLRSLFLSIFNYTMYFVIAMAVLSALGVDVSSLLAVAGIGGVAIGFGCQTLVKDFVSGLFLWIDGRINVGDVVTVAGQTGTVEAIALRTTTLRGVNGNLYAIPNGDIRTVINMSMDYRCALVDLTIAHGQDLNRVIAVLEDAMDQLDQRLDMIPEPPQVLGVIASDRGASTIRIECKCKVSEGWALEREIRLAALNRLAQEGIKP